MYISNLLSYLFLPERHCGGNKTPMMKPKISLYAFGQGNSTRQGKFPSQNLIDLANV